MPAPLTGNAVTGTGDQAGAPGTSAPAPAPPGHGPGKARALLPRRAARRTQTALPAAARSDITSSAGVETRGDRLRRVAGLLRRMPKISASYSDPLLGRPDLVEDDYYRLRNQPRDLPRPGRGGNPPGHHGHASCPAQPTPTPWSRFDEMSRHRRPTRLPRPSSQAARTRTATRPALVKAHTVRAQAAASTSRPRALSGPSTSPGRAQPHECETAARIPRKPFRRPAAGCSEQDNLHATHLAFGAAATPRGIGDLAPREGHARSR
jgi:hypothetical protein